MFRCTDIKGAKIFRPEWKSVEILAIGLKRSVRLYNLKVSQSTLSVKELVFFNNISDYILVIPYN